VSLLLQRQRLIEYKTASAGEARHLSQLIAGRSQQLKFESLSNQHPKPRLA
jgi:hypothetical protein